MAQSYKLLTGVMSRAGGHSSRGATPLVVGGGAIALVLGAGASALSNHLLTGRAEARHPPQGNFVEVDGVRLHYLEQGRGDPIVLIHGTGVSAEDFVLSGVFDTLAKTHRVIAFDRPGFGYSQRPRARRWTAQAQGEILLKALDQIGVRRSVVVGHSWGTLVVLAMGLNHPEAVSGLALVSGYYTPTPRLDVPPQIGPALPVVGDIIAHTVSPLMGRLAAPILLKQLFAPAKVTRRFKAGFSLSMALRPSQIRANAADIVRMIPEAAQLAGRHDQLTMPVVIITGAGDKVVSSRQQSERMAKEVPQSRLHIIEGAGHMVHHTAPDEVSAAIASVLEDQPAGTIPLVA